MLDQIWYLFSLELKRRILLDLNSFPKGTALSGKRILWQWGRCWTALRSPGWEGPAALGLGRLASSDTDAFQTAAGCHWQGRGAQGCPQVMQRAGEEAALREAASVS